MALIFSDISHGVGQNETTGSSFIKEYEKLIKHVGYDVLLGGKIQAMFQDFEIYHKTKVGLAEEDFELILKTMYISLYHTKKTSRRLYHWGLY